MNVEGVKKELTDLSYAVIKFKVDTDANGNATQVVGEISPDFMGEKDRDVEVVVIDGHHSPEHCHEDTVEEVRAVRGSLRIILNGEPTVLEPGGDPITIRPGVKHSLGSLDGQRARFLRYYTPKKEPEDYPSVEVQSEEEISEPPFSSF
ncbi:hypothetical protein A3E49_00955 [Candidatus Saccharibacteria bacterium RIFCSPHIGHO2_12_FULL_49_19]|nr:MAG: hypothetical protein A2708_01435 [Candidatus Saccharibacteria bacterium RIFCSPHIGHO2_01_FULL_49_21]OGL36716.1 MAG: hypothetical protein A3E49_00955 [Candidatus Saccharibacteria bacterium RIFCSPHIGHO2_12_FULL_49_19]OGL37982.1 MAG: hypothetical protein A3B63_01515 [Candidatus Saccharibacteria bacterium RIFCSPLOWO2_01_FULL_49_22]